MICFVLEFMIVMLSCKKINLIGDPHNLLGGKLYNNSVFSPKYSLNAKAKVPELLKPTNSEIA